MNSATLTKCIEELKKDAPDLSYIRGMLETLVELSAQPKSNVQSFPPAMGGVALNNAIPADDLPPGYATGPIGRIA